jgi:hypothetical protein
MMAKVRVPRWGLLMCGMMLLGYAEACNEPEFSDPPDEGDRLTLGGLVYEILHSNLERADTCGAEYADTLALDRERFVTTFDHAISEDVVDTLPDLLGGTLLPVVDSGDLPAMTDAVAEAMALLVDDELDPDRTVLTSAMEIAQTRSTLERSHVFEVARRLLNDPNLEERIHALAAIAQARDGDGNVLGTMLDLLGRNLEEPLESECEGVVIEDVPETLLATDPYVPDPAMGAPAWAVRADDNGNPRVAPRSGALPAPFVDGDGDLVADIDALGRPVDDSGTPIDLPAFGTGEGFDDEGRALGEDGELLYAYVDVKQTTLSHVLQLLRAALDADVHRDLVDVADAVLGSPTPCADGTEGCYEYPSGDHPIADLAFLLFEVAGDERAKTLIEALAVLLEEDPATAEDVLVALGDLIEAFEGSTLSLTDRELLEVAEGLVPLLDDVFAIPAGGGASTPRLLLDVIADLGDNARDFPEELGLIIDYHELHKDSECSAEMPDLSRSVPVDYDRPRFYMSSGTQVDNRSSLEQVIELLDVADCGDVPFSGDRSVAYVILDLLADREPSTVCGVIDAFLGIIDVFGGASDAVVSGALDLIGCNGDAVVAELRSLDGLAKSGALDFLIPVARVFEEQGQLELLIDILQFVAEDFRADEDGDPGTSSVVRQALPSISAAIEAGVGDPIFDLVDLLLSLETADGEPLADALIDAIAFLVDDGGTIETRQGAASTSYVLALIEPLKEIVNRLRTGRATPAFDRLVDHVGGYLTDTRTEDGREVLTDRNLVPLMTVLTDTAREATTLRPEAWQCYVGEAQSGTDELLVGRDFASVVRLVGVLERNPEGEVVEDWVSGMLDPNDPEGLYGPMLQVGAGVLGTDTTRADGSDIDVQPVVTWLGRIARQRSEDGADLVGIVDRMLQTDEDGAMLAIGRNFVNAGPLESGEAPVSTYMDIFDSVTDVSEPRMCAVDPDLRYSVDEAEETLIGVVEFMEGEDEGLGAVYGLIGLRRDGPATTTEE